MQKWIYGKSGMNTSGEFVAYWFSIWSSIFIFLTLVLSYVLTFPHRKTSNIILIYMCPHFSQTRTEIFPDFAIILNFFPINDHKPMLCHILNKTYVYTCLDLHHPLILVVHVHKYLQYSILTVRKFNKHVQNRRCPSSNQI